MIYPVYHSFMPNTLPGQDAPQIPPPPLPSTQQSNPAPTVPYWWNNPQAVMDQVWEMAKIDRPAAIAFWREYIRLSGGDGRGG